MTRRVLSVACLFLLSVCGMQTLAWAQENRGGITGTVQDSSGAVVPGVSITAIDVAQGLRYPATSTSAGVYVIPNLTVGAYRVEAIKKGFKTSILEGVTVFTGGTTTANITLQVGAVAQSVTVTSSASLLQTDGAQVTPLIEGKMYEELPLSMNANAAEASGRRQMEQFLYTEPGGNTTVEGDTYGKWFNGNQYNTAQVLIDGVSIPNFWQTGNVDQYSPPYESMAEFKVVTSNGAPEYGGGTFVENFTMKSGTNNFHGDLFEFVRNNILDAKGEAYTPVANELRMNEFGGTIGGPLSIPKLYDGHNRTFFYVAVGDYENRGGPPVAPIRTVPTAAERQGDLSALLNTQYFSTPIQVYNPFNNTCGPSGTGSGTSRCAFANNQIPVSATAKFYEQIVALPNLPGTNGGNLNNYQDSANTDTTDWTWSAKIDHSFNDRNRVSWSYWGDDTFAVYYGDQYVLTNPEDALWHGGGHRAHYYASIRPNTVNDFYAGYTILWRPVECYTASPVFNLGTEVNPANIPGTTTYLPTGAPTMAMGSGPIQYFRSGVGPTTCATVPGTDNEYAFDTPDTQVGDILDHIQGRHHLKFGGNIEKGYDTIRAAGSGSFNFTNLETSQIGNAASGDEWASFLIGAADSYSITGPAYNYQWHSSRGAVFAQDDFKITKKLTFDYGLRWDLPAVEKMKNNLLSGFDPTVPNPGAGNIPGAYVFLGYGTGRTGSSTFRGVHASLHEFQPRLGLAYSYDDKTVFRVGYGINFSFGNATNVGTMTRQWEQGQATFSASQVTPDQGVTPVLVSNGVGSPTTPLPNLNPNLFNGASPNYWDSASGLEPYVQQWNVGIQRYLPHGFFLDVGYIGAHGNHLEANLDEPNQLPISYLTTYGSLLTQAYNSPAAIAAGIQAPYAGFTGTAAQALRRFPQYQTINDNFDPSGMNDYNSLQVVLRKQVGDLHLNVNYVGQKNLGDVPTNGANSGNVGVLDAYDLHLDKSEQPSEPTRRLVGSWLWDVPVGKGKRYAEGINNITDYVIGGWEVGAIQTYQNGYILSPGGANTNPIFNTDPRPNELAGVPVVLHSCSDVQIGSVLDNINAFALNNPLQLGTAPRTLRAGRGCGRYEEDFDLQKAFPIRERAHVEFRSEFYNGFNRHKFADPSLSVNSPSTFGEITTNDSGYQPRIIQLALRLIW